MEDSFSLLVLLKCGLFYTDLTDTNVERKSQFFGADGLPRDSAEGAIPISAIDPAALMGWGGMGLPEQWQQNNSIERAIAQQQQQQQLAPAYVLQMPHQSIPSSTFNPYNPSQNQGIPQQVQFRGGPGPDPYGLAALYARQGMTQQDAFLAAAAAAGGGYQDLGPLLAAASAQASEDQAGVGVPLGLAGGVNSIPGGNLLRGRMQQPSIMGQVPSQPHLTMIDQATANANWLGYSGQEEERQVRAISQAQQQLQAVSDMMAKAKLNDEQLGQGERDLPKPEGESSNAMRRDAEGNYYFNNVGQANITPATDDSK